MSSPDLPETNKQRRQQAEVSRYFYKRPDAQCILFFCLFFTVTSLGNLFFLRDRLLPVSEYVVHAALVAGVCSGIVLIYTRWRYRKQLKSGKVAP